MRLTPLDIRKQEFKKSMRGLDGDEVYAFLSTIADEYEAVLNDNKALRERLVELDDKVQEYRNMEKTLRDTLLTAERVTVEAKDNARREAELIRKEAQIDAEKGVRDVKSNAMKLRQEIQNLRSQRETYLARMKMLVESHVKFIESAERDYEEEESQLDEMSKPTGKDRKKEQRTPEPSRESSTANIPPPAAPPPADPTPDIDEVRVNDSASKPAEEMAPRDIAELADEPVSEAVTGEASRVIAEQPAMGTETAVADELTEGAVTIQGQDTPDELNDILERMIDGQREALGAEVGSASESFDETSRDSVVEEALKDYDEVSDYTPRGSTDEGDPEELAEPEEEAQSSGWSLEKLKKDILSRPSPPDEKA
jgi:cell division initiation protein